MEEALIKLMDGAYQAIRHGDSLTESFTLKLLLREIDRKNKATVSKITSREFEQGQRSTWLTTI
ncbi:hypothetical protein ACTXT7_010581 [Hymenolepis weldensis]